MTLRDRLFVKYGNFSSFSIRFPHFILKTFQSLCCDDTTNHNLEKKPCFKETEEINSDLKYNVTHHQQEEVPIDIKDVTHLLTNAETLLEHLNSSLHTDEIETPINPKENDGLEPQEIGCYVVSLKLLTNSFNTTISSREVCNVEATLEKQTLVIPISRYMRDAQIELLFM